MQTSGGPKIKAVKQPEKTPADVSGASARVSSGSAQVNAKEGSELRLTTDSKSIKSGRGTTTITVGEGSYIRLAAGSTVANLQVSDVKRKKWELGGALIAGIIVAVIGVVLVVLSFDATHGPWVVGCFGGLTLLTLFIKEACTTFSKDTGLSKKAIDRLTMFAAAASIYVVAFGAPAAVWTTIKAVSAVVEANK